MSIDCPECGGLLEDPVDKTYSNTGKRHIGIDPNHTGDIYHCETCECSWLHSFISNDIKRWVG